MAKIFISTNPLLIHDIHRYDSIKIMTKRLLAPETHHQLLVFEGLLAITNITTCLSNGADNEAFSRLLLDLPCGELRGEAKGSGEMTLYQHLTKDLLFEKNVKIQLATCELLSNLSLSPYIQE